MFFAPPQYVTFFAPLQYITFFAPLQYEVLFYIVAHVGGSVTKLWWHQKKWQIAVAQKNVTYCGGTKNAAAKMATPQYVTLFYIVALCDHVGWSVTNCGGTKKVTNCGGAKKCDILWWRKKHSKNGYTAICHAFLHCSTLWPCWMKCDKLWWRKKSDKLWWHKKSDKLWWRKTTLVYILWCRVKNAAKMAPQHFQISCDSERELVSLLSCHCCQFCCHCCCSCCHC